MASNRKNGSANNTLFAWHRTIPIFRLIITAKKKEKAVGEFLSANEIPCLAG